MVDLLLKVHITMIILFVLFYLFALSISFFFMMILISSKGYAADLIWIALIPPTVLSVIFLKKVVVKIYDKLYTK